MDMLQFSHESTFGGDDINVRKLHFFVCVELCFQHAAIAAAHGTQIDFGFLAAH